MTHAGPAVMQSCAMRSCSVPDCISEARCKSLCDMHYKRLNRHGSTDLPTFVGRIYGSLVIRRRVGADEYGGSIVQLDCDCGKSVVWTMRKVRNESVPKHCGCGGAGSCIKAPGAAYGRFCPCVTCKRARSKARKATGRRLMNERAAELRAMRGMPDEIAVERAMRGDRPERISKIDRMEAARRMLALGYTAGQVAMHLQMTPRTVERYKASDRKAAA